MSKPTVIQYIRNHFKMFDNSLQDIIDSQLKLGKSEGDILHEILDILIDFDEID